jgi:methyl-accepting chemotaxis protein
LRPQPPLMPGCVLMFVSKAHEATATIAALNCSQAVIAFKMDGTILTANENFLAVTGYRLADIRGRSHAIFIAVKERQSTAYQRFWDGLKRGEFQAGEYRHIGKHGREVWLQATYNPILRPNGKPFKVIAFATDITARIGREGDDGASRLAPEALMLDRTAACDASGRGRHAAVWAAGDRPVALGTTPVGETMTEGTEPASRIGNVVDMINRVAAENNLAALRATIEAARASEAVTTDLHPRSQARRPAGWGRGCDPVNADRAYWIAGQAGQ